MVDLNAITDRGSLELADTGTPGSLINHAGQIVARGKDGNYRCILGLAVARSILRAIKGRLFEIFGRTDDRGLGKAIVLFHLAQGVDTGEIARRPYRDRFDPGNFL
jgi:hypothetical protein